MVQVIGSVVAGFGLFFTGLKLVGVFLKQMTTRRFRLMVARWANNSWLSGLWGSVMLIVTQSGAAVTFILVSLISSGLLTVRQALPAVFWLNGGGSLIVLIAMLDIQLIVLYLLGLAGILFYLEKPASYRNIFGVVFGLTLLFFGLHTIRAGAAPLAELDWFKSALAQTQHSYILGCLVAAVLACVVQSSIAVAFVSIALVHAGLFEVEQTLMILYGANIGGGVTVLFLSAGLKGSAKQIAMSQMLFNLLGALLFIVLFYVELYSDVPLVKDLVAATGHSIDKQMAYVFILFNIVTAIVLSFLMDPFCWILARWWPPTEQEDRSKLQYIHDQAANDPETAIDLVEKEQSRLGHLFPDYLNFARDAGGKRDDTINALHEGFVSVSGEIRMFCSELVDMDLRLDTSERLVNAIAGEDLLDSIEENLYHFAASLSDPSFSTRLPSLHAAFLEGLDTVLLTAADAMEHSPADSHVELLENLTRDRGGLMENIRRNYLAADVGLEPQEKSTLLYVTGLFERIVWLLGRLAKVLGNRRRVVRQ